MRTRTPSGSSRRTVGISRSRNSSVAPSMHG
nr:MAG TPA: hypothetical protein [Bacteriophage sp.]